MSLRRLCRGHTPWFEPDRLALVAPGTRSWEYTGIDEMTALQATGGRVTGLRAGRCKQSDNWRSMTTGRGHAKAKDGCG
jgi:hypothetical protein